MHPIVEWIAGLSQQTYPEPRCALHDSITKEMVVLFGAWLPRGAAVLDVGCGQGCGLSELTLAGFSAVGITPNADDFAACLAGGYSVHQQDMHFLTCPDGTFDAVWARHALEHSPCPLYVLRELWRVTKPLSWLYVEVPAPDTDCNHEANPNHYSVLGDKAWQHLLDKAGWILLRAWHRKLMTQAGSDIYFHYIAQKHAHAKP